MPFKSEAQRKYLWANEPGIAREWTDKHGSGIAKALGGRIGLFEGGGMTNEDLAAIDAHAATVENIVQDRGDGSSYEDRYNQMVQSHGGTPNRPPPTRTDDGYINRQIKKVPGFLANVGVAKKLNIPYLLAAYGTDYVKNKLGIGDQSGKGTIVPSNQLNQMDMMGGLKNIGSTISDAYKDWTSIRDTGNLDPNVNPNITLAPKADTITDETTTPTYTTDPTGTQNLGMLHPNPETGARILSNQAKKDAEYTRLTEEINKIYGNAEGGRIGYQQGNMVGGEMEGAMMQSKEVIKELYDAFIAQGLSPQEAIEKIKEIIASTQTQEAESPMMGEEFGRAPAAFGGIMDTYTGRRKYKLGSLKEKLEKYAPEGESLAFINKEEADLLKSRGGYGRPVNEAGIPSFFDLGDIVSAPVEIVKKGIKKLKKLASSKLGKIAMMYVAGTYLGGMEAFGGPQGGMGWKKFGHRLLNPMSTEGGISNIGRKAMSYFQKPTSKVASDWGQEYGVGYVTQPGKLTGGSEILSDARHLAGMPSWEKNAQLAKLAQLSTGEASKSLIPGVPNKVLAGIALPSIGAYGYTAAQPPEELGGEVTGEYDADLQKWKDYYAGLNATYDVNPDRLKSAQGGRIGRQEGGLMNLGGMEKDYRQEGGFVPIGGEEKADDVPARLSKNEFVFTADAVRAAGGGDIDAGAEVMENVMQNLEAGGKISEESQGEGAQGMFETSERLSEVV